MPFDSFGATVERVLGVRLLFISPSGSGSLVTAADPGRLATVATVTTHPVEEARALLTSAGYEVMDGQWSMVDPGDLECEDECFIAAVAYNSSEGRPGLWVDATGQLPSEVQVLKSLFEEFRSTGELAAVSFEEFVRHANPNVVILSPSDLRSFLSQKGG